MRKEKRVRVQVVSGVVQMITYMDCPFCGGQHEVGKGIVHVSMMASGKVPAGEPVEVDRTMFLRHYGESFLPGITHVLSGTVRVTTTQECDMGHMHEVSTVVLPVLVVYKYDLLDMMNLDMDTFDIRSLIDTVLT